MTSGPEETAPQVLGAGGRSTAEVVNQLTNFTGPPEQFVAGLLALQCRLSGASGGAFLRIGPEQTADILAVHPPLPDGAPAPPWIGQLAEFAGDALKAGKTTVKPLHGKDDLYGQEAKRHLVMVPLSGEGFSGLVAYVIESQVPAALNAARDRLEATVGFLNLYEMRQALQRRQFDIERLRVALKVLPAVNEHDRFVAAAMAFCNEAAARWQCERVGLGFLKGRYVHLRAMSHTDKFSRKMKLVQDIEAAMEECLDQDTEVLYPSAPDATYVSRAAAELSRRHGPTAILSLPLRRRGEVVAVLTLERAADRPFDLPEIESIRLTCELCTARLVSLYEHDRWFGARMARGARKALAFAVGPKHTWKKLVAMLVLAVAVFAVVARGDYTVEAPFSLVAARRQVVPAPFDGYLKEVNVKPGDKVVADRTVLARFETAELELELAAKEADRATYLTQAVAAMKEEKLAEAEIARTQARRVAKQIELLEYQIARASIRSPISGTVVKGDMERHIGAQFKTGTVLFEVAPIDSLRAELAVPEDEISDVRTGGEKKAGRLATKTYPDQRFEFEIERINPIAEVVNRRNVFKVRARLLETAEWMRPGLEGRARIHIGRRRKIWLWTHRMVKWLRMRLWL